MKTSLPLRISSAPFCSATLALLAAFVLGACKPAPSPEDAEIAYYQSPMHPWITSDKPGQCTICGMDLAPVRKGESGAAMEPGMVSLSNATIETIGIATAPVRFAPLSREIRLAGRMEDDDSRHRIIAAFFDGRVEKAFVEQVGENVSRNQPLAELYSPELLYVVREYQVAAQRSNDPQARNARQRLIQFGLQPNQIDSLAKSSKDSFAIPLLSPIDGTVVARNIYPGKYFKTGDPLLELADFSTMWFHAQVYERDLASIRVGQKALVTTPAAPGKTFDGIVTFIDLNFDAITRSTKVRIEVPNPVVQSPSGPRRELPHRAYAEAMIRASEDKAFLVPRQAILDDGRGAVVFVKRDASVFERRPVQVGRRGDDSAEILSGVAEGDEVVINGNLLLDAEAQLAFAGGGHSPEPHSHLESSVASAWQPLMEAVDRLTRALADEDVTLFAREAAGLPALGSTLPPDMDPDIKPLAEALRGTLDFPETPDLPAARRAFTPFSQAAAKLALALAGKHQLPPALWRL